MMQNDLISRSALLKNRTRMTEYDETGCGVHVFVVTEEDVLNAPAADAAPVRHGRWYDTGRISAYKNPIYQCSVCMHRVEDHYIKYHKYCLHCGSKMDGGAKNAAD